MNTAAAVVMIATYWVGGGAPSEGGNYLANGQVYNNKEFVAAHRTLPFGTVLNVCLRRQCVSASLESLDEVKRQRKWPATVHAVPGQV
jgi:hypothetical protein